MPTKADFDAEMVSRVTSALLAAAKLSVLVDGTNPDTVGPLRWAYRILKMSPLTGVTITDSDLALVSFNQFLDLSDLGEYRLLQSVVSGLTKNRIQIGVNSIYFSDMRDALIRRLAELAKGLNAKFGILTPSLVGATIDLNNVEPDDDDLSSDEQGGW